MENINHCDLFHYIHKSKRHFFLTTK